MKINEVASLTGITIRALHYYDQIGLLKPSDISQAGYRLYDNQDVETLQQILFFKELDFPLKQIKAIMQNPTYDKSEALKNHLDILLKKKEHINDLINLLERLLKGENSMSFKEFDISEIESAKAKYAKEVEERFGGTPEYAQYQQKANNYSAAQWQAISEEASSIFNQFAANIGKDPKSPEVQALVEAWQAHITKNYYTCSKEILLCLSAMYTQDERFKQNIDSHGEGTAELMSKAIAYYCTL